jgi:hypothetical protein
LKIFLETSSEKRKKWSSKRKDELKKKISDIAENELQKILVEKNGDCTKFATAVVNDMPPDSCTYMGDGEHTLAYSAINNEILIIDSMYKEIIKFSDDNSPIWVKDRKINIKNSARNEQGEQKKYYPEKDEGLIVKGIDDPSTVVVWRVKRVKGEVNCHHDHNCAHKPFERLFNWQAAIRQSLFLWTMKGQCVILFRTCVKEGPGFDGQIDFRAGEKSIIRQAKRSEGERDLELAQLSRRQLARRQAEEGEEGCIEESDESGRRAVQRHVEVGVKKEMKGEREARG